MSQKKQLIIQTANEELRRGQIRGIDESHAQENDIDIIQAIQAIFYIDKSLPQNDIYLFGVNTPKSNLYSLILDAEGLVRMSRALRVKIRNQEKEENDIKDLDQSIDL